MTTAMMRERGSGGWAPPVATLLCILPVVVSLFRSLINVIVFHSKEYCDNYNVYMWHTLCTLSKCTVYFAKFCITTLNLASLLQISAYPIFQMPWHPCWI